MALSPPAAADATPANTWANVTTEQLYHLLAPVTLSPSDPRSRFTNWGKSFTCKPLSVFEPSTEHECGAVLELARRERTQVRFVGVGHSPSDLACTRAFMLRTERLDRILEVNVDKNYVTAQGGITLHALHAGLISNGLCLPNCGSISDQTLAGVISTATHGSGTSFGVLSTHVLSLHLMLADGSKVQCSRTENEDLFLATLCGLGATGLILSAQIQVETAFRLREEQESLDFDECVARMPEMAPTADHVRFWWFPQARIIRTSVSNRTSEPINPAGNWFWGSLIGFHVVQFLLFLGRFCLPYNPLNNWTARLAAWLVSSPSVGVDESINIYNVDCRYPQYTTEWAIPFVNTQACLNDLRDMLEEEFADPKGVRPHFPVEIRFSAADDIWLSPSHGQLTTWIGIVQYRPYGLAVPYRHLFSRFEDIIQRHGGRPHWAKAHPLRPAELRALYPRFDDFCALRQRVDPDGLFANPYVERHILGVATPEAGARVFKRADAQHEK